MDLDDTPLAGIQCPPGLNTLPSRTARGSAGVAGGVLNAFQEPASGFAALSAQEGPGVLSAASAPVCLDTLAQVVNRPSESPPAALRGTRDSRAGDERQPLADAPAGGIEHGPSVEAVEARRRLEPEPLFEAVTLAAPAPPPPPRPLAPLDGADLVGELVPSAGFATRAPEPGHPDRRLWLLEVLRPDSAVTRTEHCRCTPIGAGRQGSGETSAGAEPQYRRKEQEDGDPLVYVSGLQTCGRITCPVCGVRIRRAERERMRHLCQRHLDAGGSLYHSVFSLSHGPLDDPEETLEALNEGRRRAIGSKAGGAWAKDRARFGVIGVTWHLDPPPIRWNGMHWHSHQTWFLDRELEPDELEALEERVQGRYIRAVEKQGRRALAEFNRIEPVRSAEKAADYAAKSDGGHSGRAAVADSIAGEAAQGDAKQAKGRVPLEFLAEWGETGDYAALRVFQTYERALDGRTWRYKPAALIRLYGAAEEDAVDAPEAEEVAEGSAEEQAAAILDDAADASDEVGGAVVLRPGLDGWRVIRRTRGADRWIRGLLRQRRDVEARAYVGWLLAAEEATDRGPP